MSPEGGATYAAVAAAAAAAATAVQQQPSGPLKPTAKESDPSEHDISHEMAQRHISLDMSGPMSGIADGTNTNARVANASLPAGQRINKIPIFISGVKDTRAFLAWLRGSCPSQLLAQLKAESWLWFRPQPTVLEVRSARCGLSTGRVV